MSKKKLLVWVLGVVLVFVLGYGAYFGYSLYKFTNIISQPADTEDKTQLDLPKPKPQENINILVVGIDAGQIGGSYRNERGRTDTIMIFSLNPNTNKISLLSVPRDTYVNIADRGMDKVNHAYAFGGIELSIKTLSQFLGININHYVRVNYDSFIKIVDGLGGVTVNVTEDVRSYQSENKVSIPKGVHTMNGEQAFDYIRVREGDIVRVQRQQNFVKTLVSQKATIGNIPKIPGILNSIAADIRTDMSPQEMLDLLMKVRSMDTSDIHNEIIPGRSAMINGVSYWVPDPSGSKAAVERVFR